MGRRRSRRSSRRRTALPQHTPTRKAAPSDWGGRQTRARTTSLARNARAPTPGGYLMHTLSTRTLSALAYDRGEDYDPADPVCPDLLEALSLVEQARPVIGEDGPYERARQRQRERRQADGIPDWFSAEDLIAAPWDTADSRFVLAIDPAARAHPSKARGARAAPTRGCHTVHNHLPPKEVTCTRPVEPRS